MSDIVTDLEKIKRGWHGGLPETPCGYGSTLAATKAQREWIPKVVKKYRIKTIADVGAGDLNWFYRMTLPKTVKVAHFDVYPRRPDVIEFDLLHESPPPVDMILCLWVLNHFDMDSCRQALANLEASGAKYLMMTDRPIWHKEQPPEIVMEYVEELKLNSKGDRIILCPLR
jgi:hypothetical protein